MIYNEKWEDLLTNFDPQDGTLWTISKSLKRKPLRSNKGFHGPQGIVYDDADKAEEFADSLKLNCSPIKNDITDDRIGQIDNSVTNFLDFPFLVSFINPLPPFTFDELQLNMFSLKNRSAPGVDGINNTALKYLSKKEKVQLLSLFNSSFQHGYFPSALKKPVWFSSSNQVKILSLRTTIVLLSFYLLSENSMKDWFLLESNLS